MAIKVSVVVPIYNPGQDLERCVNSLLAQTLPSEELELLLVDDGSTDDTLARLRDIETSHHQVRVISIPNSGWPGKPRNVGTDAATGDFVMYVDQDDSLEPEALERMHDLGSDNDADIVLGKVTSDFRGVHQYLYREQRPRCTIYDARLINSQTPHKMLRRQFLIDNGIRYPEGRRRLEDQLFMTKAYFAAHSCSIVADYVCYRYLKRSDGANAGEQRIDPPSYYENLRDVLDVIDTHTEPGLVRDHFYRRFLRVEMLGKLSGRKVVKTRFERGDIWLDPIRQLAEERFPISVDDGLPTIARLRAHLMRHGTFADAKNLTARTRRVQPEVRMTLTGVGDGRAALRLVGELVDDGVPVSLQPHGEHNWLLPEAITGPATPGLRQIDDPAEMVADVVVISRKRADEWFVDHSLTVEVVPQEAGSAHLRIAGEVVLDPATAAGGRPMADGRHDLSVRLDALGLNRLRPLKVDQVTTGRSETLAVISTQPRTLLNVARSGRASLEVGVSGRSVRQRVGPVTADWVENRLVVELGADWFASSSLTAELRSQRDRVLTVRLSPHLHQYREWRSTVTAVPPGRYAVRLRLPRAGAVEIDEPVMVPGSPLRVLTAAARRLVGVSRRFWRRLRVARHSDGLASDHEASPVDERGR